ncbi:MAG: class I SAM-dependent methyltransferase [Nitrospirae bacterium]|nr:class I SAM-dependent methyltransferase [Nitrospirota bacterium]
MKPNASDNWDDHWGKQNSLADYNPGQILRHRLVFGEINKISKKKATLLVDFGSGQGDLIKKLSREFKNIKMIGLEYSQIGVEISRQNNPGATFIQADLTQDLFIKELYRKADIITCCDVLEHVDYPEKIVKNALNLLEQDGVLIITLPGGPMSKLDIHIGHRRHYNKYSLSKLLQQCGFNKIQIVSAGWPFFNLYRLMLLFRGDKLVNDVSFNTSAIKTRLIQMVGLLFSLLFRGNINSSKYGWQIIAIATKE